MSTVIEYDEAWTKRVESIYRTPDVANQRNAVLGMLNAMPGEHILDVGSGPGMLAYAIGKRVGPGGIVEGVDISEEMNLLAAARCADLPWVSFRKNDATRLPFQDASFEAAVSTQVYEYVEDVDLALAELYRVLKPGGRAVILDTDWDSLVWNTGDPLRMGSILKEFELHCAHPFLARYLIPMLANAGFEIRGCLAHTIINRHLDPNTYSFGILAFIESYVRELGSLDKAVIQAWRDELYALEEQGAYFFSLNRYLFITHKA